MPRHVEDTDYLNTLPSELYRRRYFRWKTTMLNCIDDICSSLHEKSLEEVMSEYNLTPRDIALLVRLGYFSDEEIDTFDLRKIESSVPV